MSQTLHQDEPLPPYVPVDHTTKERLEEGLEKLNIKVEKNKTKYKSIRMIVSVLFPFLSLLLVLIFASSMTRIKILETEIETEIKLKIEENSILVMQAMEKVNDLRSKYETERAIGDTKRPCLIYDEDKDIVTFAKEGQCLMQPPRYGIETPWYPCYMKVGKGRYDYAEEGDCEFYF